MAAQLSPRETLARTFALYRDAAGPLISVAAIIFLPISLVSELLAQQSTGSGAGFSLALSGSAAFLYAGVVAPLVPGAGGAASSRAGTGSPGPGAEGIRALWSQAVGTARSLILAGLLYTLGTTAGTILLIVPGLILVTIWAVAPAAARLEGVGPVAALGRSRELVRGNAWRVFGAVIAVVLVALAVTLAAQLLAVAVLGEDGGAFVGSWLGVVLAAPPLGLLPTVLYVRLAAARAADAVGERDLTRGEETPSA